MNKLRLPCAYRFLHVIRPKTQRAKKVVSDHGASGFCDGASGFCDGASGFCDGASGFCDRASEFCA